MSEYDCRVAIKEAISDIKHVLARMRLSLEMLEDTLDDRAPEEETQEICKEDGQ